MSTARPTDSVVLAEPVSNRRWLALVVLLAGQFMASLDTTIGNVAAPSIARDLRVSAGATALAVAAYTLLYASMLITGARLGADRGRRRIFVIGIVVFTAASTATGAAPDGVVLIIARAAQGLGAALAIPQAISFIQADFAGRARARALATYGAMISFGASVGLAAGGALIKLDVAGFGWRTVFLINLPVDLAVVIVATRVLPSIPPSPRRLDLIGVRAAHRGCGPDHRHAGARPGAGMATAELGRTGRRRGRPGRLHPVAAPSPPGRAVSAAGS